MACHSSVFNVCQMVLLVTITIPGRSFGYTAWSCAPWNGTQTSPVRGHAHLCYIYTEFKMTWSAGEKYCRQHGGIFAKEKSRLTNEFFRTKLLIKPGGTSEKFCFWFGLNDKGSAGNWKWSDGENLAPEYTNRSLVAVLFGWLESRLVDCASLCTASPRDDGLNSREWLRNPCTKSYRVLCQFDAITMNIETTEFIAETTVGNYIEDSQAKPKRRPRPRRKTGVFVFELPNQREARLTSTPDWKITAFTTTSCARHCQDLADRCQVFNYSVRSRECHVFSSERVISGGWEPGEGWSTWRVEIRDTY